MTGARHRHPGHRIGASLADSASGAPGCPPNAGRRWQCLRRRRGQSSTTEACAGRTGTRSRSAGSTVKIRARSKRPRVRCVVRLAGRDPARRVVPSSAADETISRCSPSADSLASFAAPAISGSVTWLSRRAVELPCLWCTNSRRRGTRRAISLLVSRRCLSCWLLTPGSSAVNNSSSARRHSANTRRRFRTSARPVMARTRESSATSRTR